MSRYDGDQEQLEAIKAWWAKYGTLLLSVVLVVVLAFSGWRYWQSYQFSQAASASAIYEVLDMSQSNGVFGEVSREARKLMQEQPASPYAGAAAMMLAQFHWQKAEKDEAIEALNWLMQSPQSDALKQVAGFRLARIYLAQQDVAKATEVVASLEKLGAVGAQQANLDYLKAQLAQANQAPEQAYQALQRVVENEQAAADLRNLAQLLMDDLVQK
jgi:predicted negative regulator of RcsB-dependent stress response